MYIYMYIFSYATSLYRSFFQSINQSINIYVELYIDYVELYIDCTFVIQNRCVFVMCVRYTTVVVGLNSTLTFLVFSPFLRVQ